MAALFDLSRKFERRALLKNARSSRTFPESSFTHIVMDAVEQHSDSAENVNLRLQGKSLIHRFREVGRAVHLDVKPASRKSALTD